MLSADPGKIAAFLDDLAAIGRDEAGGWTRLAYSAEERTAHRLFRDRLAEYGLSVREDAAGNSYGRLAGHEELPALSTGSHLDTVYQGGNFDGAVGVAAGVELARLAAAEGGLRHPIDIVAFAGEEGARFGAPCIGSRLATGAYDRGTLERLIDRDGVSALAAARNAGLPIDEVAGARWDFSETLCFVEIHIEQGRVLETREHALGVVTVIGGSTRVELTFDGHADHSGATPMWLRRDALAAAAEFVVATEERARAYATTVATVGRLDVTPNSLTTVPGKAVLGLDVRDIDSDRQRDVAEQILDDAVRIAGRRGISVSARRLSDQSPVSLHRSVGAALAEAAARQRTPIITQPSGASHDTAHLAHHLPCGMLFVPCRDGVSHAPDEHADPVHIATAVDVLLDAFHRISDGAAG